MEAAYQAVLDASQGAAAVDALGETPPPPNTRSTETATADQSSASTNGSLSVATHAYRITPLRKPVRQRNKAHLTFVASQPCLVCQRTPSDAHHLKFAQPRTLGRKVSDEFTVPLCRDHHLQLHHYGNESAWWTNLNITPLETAKELWTATSQPTVPCSPELLTSRRS